MRAQPTHGFSKAFSFFWTAPSLIIMPTYLKPKHFLTILLTIFCAILFWMYSIPFGSVQPAYAYNTGSEKAHQWILAKAIETLEREDSRWGSIRNYLDWINWGVWYADHSELRCKWSYNGSKEYSCDQIHHYGKVEDIKLHKAGLPTSGVTVANPGEFAAPFYTQVLYDQALRFLPSEPKPSLALLPYKKAGYITAIFSGALLDSTYVGGLPFCEKRAFLEGNTDLISAHECPKWPEWAALDNKGKVAKESVETAMKYLGWAMHLVQDLTVPYHAENEASESHQTYEDKVDNWIQDGSFIHLPVSPDSTYSGSHSDEVQ